MSSMSCASSVCTQCRPQTSDSRRAVSMLGVSAMIGASERSRAARSAVDAGLGPADDGAGVDRLGHFMHRRHDRVGRGGFRRRALGFDDGLIARIGFHREGDAVHHRHGFDRIGAGRRFRRQHHGVGAVEHGGRHVGDFGAGRHGRLDHRFQHLGRHHHRLARLARGAGDLFLQAGHALPAAAPRPDRRAPPSAHRPVPGSRAARPAPWAFRSWPARRRGPPRSSSARPRPRAAARRTARSSRRPDCQRGIEIAAVLGRHGRHRQQRVGHVDALAVLDLAADLHDRLGKVSSFAPSRRSRTLPSSISRLCFCLMAGRLRDAGSECRLGLSLVSPSTSRTRSPSFSMRAAARNACRAGSSAPAGRPGCRWAGRLCLGQRAQIAHASGPASSWRVWLILMRKTSTPASNSARIFSGVLEAGPRVARILVLRRRLIAGSGCGWRCCRCRSGRIACDHSRGWRNRPARRWKIFPWRRCRNWCPPSQTPAVAVGGIEIIVARIQRRPDQQRRSCRAAMVHQPSLIQARPSKRPSATRAGCLALLQTLRRRVRRHGERKSEKGQRKMQRMSRSDMVPTRLRHVTCRPIIAFP